MAVVYLPICLGSAKPQNVPFVSYKRVGLSQLNYTSIWSEWRDSNPRHRGPKPRALSAELHPDIAGVYI